MVEIIKPKVSLVTATPQNLIATTARACYQSYDGADADSDARLLKHFVKNGESPLEFAWACVDITCSYAAHVHLLRHRFFSFQWRSQRYDDTMGFVLPDGLASLDAHAPEGLSLYLDGTQDLYEGLRANGAKKQDARYIIPQAVAVQGFMAGSARAWLHFLRLRTSPKAMPETREVANQIKDALHTVWPDVIE